MKKTIHYMSDIKWFSQIRSTKYSSKRHMVRAHIKYINKNAVERLGDEKNILDTVDMLDKKENSRVAFSFNVAIPNDIQKSEYKQFLQDVVKFFSEKFDIDEKNIYAVIHETHELGKALGTENKHIHIVANTRTRQDKQIRIQPKDLKQLHKDWDAFLQQKGYIIENKGLKERVFGINIRKDKELQEAYKEYLKAREELEQAQKTLPSPNYSQSRTQRQPEPVQKEPEPRQPEPTRTPPKPPTKQPIQTQIQDKEFAMRLSVASTTDRKPHPTEFVEREIRTLSELKSVIRSSYYSNIIWQDGYRSSKNAKGVSNFLVFDVDGTDTIERVYRTLKEKNIRAILTTTKSHTEQEHHFRILIKLNRELTESELLYFKQLMKLIMKDLELNADTSAFDLARMYAPYPKATFFFVDGKELMIDTYTQQAKELYEFDLQQTFIRQIPHKQKKQEQHWIYVDVETLINVDIEDLIDHFETITKRWKEGNQIYLKTQKGNKYDINKEWNVCYNFYDAKGYGVISYLQEQLNTTHLLNIATYLEKNKIATGLLVLNEQVFGEKIGKCIDKASDLYELIDNIKQEFNVKSAFIDMNKREIKIGQFKIELDDEMHEKLVDAFVPQKRSPGRSPGL